MVKRGMNVQQTDGFTDRTVTCRSCGKDFEFTAGEQAFYRKLGYRRGPRRCPPCREVWKEHKREAGYQSKPWGIALNPESDSSSPCTGHPRGLGWLSRPLGLNLVSCGAPLQR